MRANSSAAGVEWGVGVVISGGGVETEDPELPPPPDPSLASLLDVEPLCLWKGAAQLPQAKWGHSCLPLCKDCSARIGLQPLGVKPLGTLEGLKKSLHPPSFSASLLSLSSSLSLSFPSLSPSLPLSFPLIFLISLFPQLSPHSLLLSSCPHPSPSLKAAHSQVPSRGWEWVSFSSPDPGVFAGCSRAGDRDSHFWADPTLHFL